MKFSSDITADQMVAMSHLHRGQLLAGLKAVANRAPVRGLEVGCYKGETSVWLLENGVTHLTVVDTFEGSPEHHGVSGLLAAFQTRTAEWTPQIKVMATRSALALPRLIGEGEQFDFIYVDGSHSSRDVLLDAVLGWQLLRPGGVMVFDDYLWKMMRDPMSNPGPAVNAFWSIYDSELSVISAGYQMVFQKLK